jgi:hypothetical protein
MVFPRQRTLWGDFSIYPRSKVGMIPICPVLYMSNSQVFSNLFQLCRYFLISVCLSAFAPNTEAASERTKPLREGDILPKLIWTDQEVRENVHIVRIGKNHIMLRVDGEIQSLSQDRFIHLYLNTHETLAWREINALALEIGGGKPGRPTAKQVIPGFVFPKLVWTDGVPRNLVEILNCRHGYYVLRIDGQTQVLDKEKFLSVLQNTKSFMANVNGQLPALLPDPGIAKVHDPNNPIQANPMPVLPPPPGRSALEPPPSPPGAATPSQRPVYFDFQFQGDPTPPSTPASGN